jgi:hypothetical protein
MDLQVTISMISIILALILSVFGEYLRKWQKLHTT